MIYPIKIYDKENKLVRTYDEKEALRLFVGDTYTVSDGDRKQFWNRVWTENKGQSSGETCGALKLKKPRKSRIFNCKFCDNEIKTTSPTRKWCNSFCRDKYRRRHKTMKTQPEYEENKIFLEELKLDPEKTFVIKCKNCTKEVVTTSLSRIWCSDACRQQFKRMAQEIQINEEDMEWEIERDNPYPYHVYLYYRPKQMKIEQVSEHGIYEAKHFCIKELKWRLKNWDEYVRSRVRVEE